jgi:endonuclease/exonuclease/phosphatase (EEP) superfamily protein YafD
VVLAITLLLHAAYLVGDRTWWGEWIAIWPPIGWLVLLLLPALRLRSFAGLAALALLVVAHGDVPRVVRGEPAPGRRLRVVSWNVAGDPAAWEHLRPLDPDLVLVQEQAGPPSTAWTGYTWQPGMDAAALSRFPIAALPSRSVGPWTDPQVLLLSHEGRRMVVVNVRLVLPSIVTYVADGFRGSPRAGFEKRVAQYPALAQLVRDAAAAAGTNTVVLCGDFNAPATAASLAPVRALFTDAWAAAGRGWGPTATAHLPVSRIDHCWSNADLRPVSAVVRTFPVSDHRALIVDYALE